MDASVCSGPGEESFSLQEQYGFRIRVARSELAHMLNRLQVLSREASSCFALDTKKSAEADFILCPGEDLNLHPRKDIHLKDACIPISPPGRAETINEKLPNAKRLAAFTLKLTQQLLLSFLQLLQLEPLHPLPESRLLLLLAFQLLQQEALHHF